MKLNNKDILNYQTSGVVVLRNIISSRWLNKLGVGIRKNFESPSKYFCIYEKNKDKNLFYDDYCNWKRINEYKDFLFNSPLANIASDLMISKKVNIFHEHVLIKESGTTKITPWHQDQSYYCVQGSQNVSFWIPLDKISKITCPEFVLKSHKWTKKFLPTKFLGDNYEQKDKEFEKIPDIENKRHDYKIISYELEPGDLIAFNFATVHGAPGNKSKNRRRAFSARFTGDDARYIKRKGEMSPPFPELKLKNGDRLECETFPEVKITN
jgi:ectoine hydroxylase-related dioxygenase (phytanoyl-CoA dioxygenase family)